MLLKSISYSSYRDYIKCPRLFWYKRILKIQEDEEHLPLVFGKAFHSGLEKMEKDNVHPMYVFSNEFARDKVSSISLEKFEEEHEEGIRLLEYWFSNRKRFFTEFDFTVAESEVSFELKVDQDPLSKQKMNLPPIHGIVDFVTNNGKIGDYKTSSKKYSQEMVDTSDQPTFYYLWHLLERGKLPTSFIYIVFRKGIKKEPIQILETTRTMKQVSELLASIQEVVMKIENKEFYRRHDDNERFCDCDSIERFLTVKLW